MFEEFNNQLKELDIEVVECFKDYQPKLSIDIYNLEKECAQHSQWYSDVKLVYAKANSLLHRVQLLVKEIKAELSIDIRNHPESYDISGKLSEALIMSIVDASEEGKTSRQLREKAERLNTEMEGLVAGFDHRRSMLNNQVQLYLSKLSDSFKQNNVKEMTKSLEGKGSDKFP